MEKIKKKIYNMSLIKSLILIFIIFVICTAILSIVTIFVSVRIQRLVLDSRTLSFEVTSENTSLSEKQRYEIKEPYQWSELTASQKILYYGSVVGMTILIVFYVLAGGLLAGNIYYKVKLRKPLEILKNGIDNITEGNLDFSTNYICNDEMGLLCGAVEKMVQELINDKKRIWLLLEERHTINASISHDLGTPITVVKGYIEFLKKNLSQHYITEEILMETLDNIYHATGRMERYIESVRNVQKIDEIDIFLKEENISELLVEMENDFKKVAEQYSKKLTVYNFCENKKVSVDKAQFFRVMENIVVNALKYAKHLVIIDATEARGCLRIRVKDDGMGFTQEDINNATKLFYSKSKDEKNMGLGLYISNLLCEKQGAKLYVKNAESGGGEIVVQVKSKVD